MYLVSPGDNLFDFLNHNLNFIILCNTKLWHISYTVYTISVKEDSLSANWYLISFLILYMNLVNKNLFKVRKKTLEQLSLIYNVILMTLDRFLPAGKKQIRSLTLYINNATHIYAYFNDWFWSICMYINQKFEQVFFFLSIEFNRLFRWDFSISYRYEMSMYSFHLGWNLFRDV